MKNTYYLVEADRSWNCAEVIGTFTNKKKAIEKCRDLRTIEKAGNALRRSEGNHEINMDQWAVTTSNVFPNGKVDRSFRIF